MKKTIKNLITSAAFPAIVVFIFLNFFQLFKSDYKSLDINSLDPAWVFTIQNPEKGPNLSGRDYYFTYGPLAHLFTNYSHNIDNPSVVFFISNLFWLCLSMLFCFQIYLFTKNFVKIKVFSMLLLLPAFFIVYYQTNQEFLVLATLYLLSFTHTFYNRKQLLLFLGVVGSLFMLIKFNMGIYIFAFTGFLILLAAKNTQKLFRETMLLSSIALATSFLLFVISTGTLNYIQYIVESIKITLGYKEYMSVTFFFGSDHHVNLIVSILFLILGVLGSTSWRNTALFFLLSYFILNVGWVRNDGHMSLVYFMSIFVGITTWTKVVFVKNSLAYKAIVSLLLFSVVIFSIAGFRLLGFKLHKGIEFLTQDLYAPWTIPSINSEKFNVESQKILLEIGSDAIDIIKSKSKTLVLPWSTHLPVIIKQTPLYLGYMQLYQNYTESAEEISIESIKENFKDLTIILQNLTIDNRIYLGENPYLILNVLNNFALKHSSENLAVLLPIDGTFQVINQVDEGGKYRILKVELETSVLQKMMKLLLKPPEICIQINDSRGVTHVFRTYETQLRKGILLKPFFADLNDLRVYLEDRNENQIVDYSIFKCHNPEYKYKFNSYINYYN